ncbi:MAG: hypothetical protein LBN31_08575 [Hungatella sp.]|nr:hypothetical protein [Hungatella sp.]
MECTFANGKNCPHKEIPEELKSYYNLVTGRNFYYNCYTLFEGNNFYCFEKEIGIDWEAVDVDFKKFEKKCSGGA